jgi:simple sugar transport system ATP-binding protein
VNALRLDTYALGKRFGALKALDDVSIAVQPGTVHALLGENGAGKSTLVKCVVGYQRPDAGSVLIDGREVDIASPASARALGIGMVYQHFTVVPGMTVAENLLIARGALPAVIDWRRVRAELTAFMDSAPFRLDLDAMPRQLSAGEKQKLEILKQLYLRPRLLILDEPTSVLTPQEADEVLGALRERAHAGQTTVVLITHKFREVMAFADDVSVLRRGRLAGAGAVAETSPAALGALMVGEDTRARDEATPSQRLRRAAGTVGELRLSLRGVAVMGDRGEVAVDTVDLDVRGGEIMGIAGVAGNGQRELMEALAGQRGRAAGSVTVSGHPYHATRAQNRALRVRGLPEEPLRNGCVAQLSVAHNIGLRSFDVAPFARAGFRVPGALEKRARELSEPADVLLVSNPVFGLDFTAVAEVHARLIAARDRGTAVLMVSEDLDELLQVADRIVVMSGGRLVHQCAAADANRHTLGRFMGGHGPADVAAGHDGEPLSGLREAA